MAITGSGRTIRPLTLLLAALVSFATSSVLGEDYSSDVADTEKKAYSFAGYAEFRPVYIGLDRTAAFYRLRFHDQGSPSRTTELNFKLQPEAGYEYGICQLYARGNFDFDRDYMGWAGEANLYEGYLSVKPSTSLDVQAGQKTLRWGKGYAWNPVAFLDRPKNPDDPELPREGYAIVTADYTMSFAGPLRTISFSPVLLPVTPDVNRAFGAGRHLNAAGKLYGLLYDTDLDLVVLARGSGPAGYGIDFSRNLLPELEIHGEASIVEDFVKASIDRNGIASRVTIDAKSCLLGARYQTKTDAILIAEYFRNGKGYRSTEMKDFVMFSDLAYSTYLASGNAALLQRASRTGANAYGAVNPMVDYLYVRASQPEPFGLLYLTPSLTCVANLGDGSFSVAPEILYTRITNLELRLKAMVLSGAFGSEFGERAGDYRLELRARAYF
jgi:hypothetical protein